MKLCINCLLLIVVAGLIGCRTPNGLSRSSATGATLSSRAVSPESQTPPRDVDVAATVDNAATSVKRDRIDRASTIQTVSLETETSAPPATQDNTKAAKATETPATASAPDDKAGKAPQNVDSAKDAQSKPQSSELPTPELPLSESPLLETPPLETQSSDEDRTFSFIPPSPDALTPSIRSGMTLDEVIQSVYSTYPLLQASLTQRQQAAGQQLGTWGAFDLNASASTENQFTGFYENYRHKMGLSRNIYSNGGRWFSQYTAGRGEFEPWYKEREKQEGGEFLLGMMQPLKQGRDIDARRAAIWRATYEMQRVEPAIQRDLIAFVFDGSSAYWQWVAAGQRYELAKSLFDVAEVRNRQFKRRLELGDIEKPLVTENTRLVLRRQGLLLDAERQLEQAAAQLSLFYRDNAGRPLSVDRDLIPQMTFENVVVPDPQFDLNTALASRPELLVINAERRKHQVTLAESQNNLMPKLDAFANARQDVGGKASSKDDKQEFEFEAGLFFDVPIERRRARGQITETQAKLAQLTSQLRMAQDKILVDLEVAAAAIEAAAGRVDAARQSISLASKLVDVELRSFDVGNSSLLEVTLREQQLFESTEDLISAMFDLNVARAAYRAALGIDRL